MWQFLVEGGPVMFFLVAASVVSVAFIIERGMVLQRKKVIPPELQKAVDPQSGFGLDRLGYAYAVAGRKSEALKTLAELQALAGRKYVPPHSFAYIYAGLGDKERAFEWLEKGYTGRDDSLTRLKTEPLFDSLRSDPRYTDLMRRVGLR